MSFTDQKPRLVTKEDLTAPWSGYRDGSHFYCHICGHSFIEGDTWRWIFAGGKGMHNLMVCGNCDSDSVLDRWEELYNEWEELSKGRFRFIATRFKDAENCYNQGCI